MAEQARPKKPGLLGSLFSNPYLGPPPAPVTDKEAEDIMKQLQETMHRVANPAMAISPATGAPYQMDLFGDTLVPGKGLLGPATVGRKVKFSPPQFKEPDFPKMTPEQRAQMMIDGVDPDADAPTVDSLMRSLMELEVSDLKLTQSSGEWGAECVIRVRFDDVQRDSHGDPIPFPTHKTARMGMAISGAPSCREALQELVLATQLYVSSKSIQRQRVAES